MTYDNQPAGDPSPAEVRADMAKKCGGLSGMVEQQIIASPAGVLIAPVHLKNLEMICTTFKRTEEKVKRWQKKGAPIAFDGYSYSAEYNQLQAWLVQNSDR